MKPPAPAAGGFSLRGSVCLPSANVNGGWVGRWGNKRFVALPRSARAIAAKCVPYGTNVAIPGMVLEIATKYCLR